MLFNSLQFLLFFPIVVTLYWGLPYRYRNGMLLVASYYFYMNWEPVYALLIAFTTVTTWWCSKKIDESGNKRGYLTVSLLVNFSILFIYKYLNFAAESVYALLDYFGLRMNVPHYDLLLPVGISFYTFQAIGYTIDVYRGTINHEKHIFTYALFVAFFPQLVAGPIERASNLLPQFHRKHKFCGLEAVEGLKLMLWGGFMKLCIAENVAPYVDAVYNNMESHNGFSILLATFLFTFQIFCDFGGYSLIAIGCARCMNFSLMQNFNRPYLSCSVKDFWRRWHISLSSWFAEYVYIPLGGSRCPELKHQRNILLTMLISGVWHGANWTFVMWGGYHGCLQVIVSLKQKIKCLSKVSGNAVINILVTFIFVMFGWIFFRANTMNDALLAFRKIFTESGMLYIGEGRPSLVMYFFLIFILIFKEIKDELRWNIHLIHNKNIHIASLSSAALLAIILLCAKFQGGQFIYFQF